MSIIENKSNSDDRSHLIDIDLLDDPGNRYQFEVVLGEGTFGQVWKKINKRFQNRLFSKNFWDIILFFFARSIEL